jgi:XTP/dITP diphosphohydrolase
MGVKLYCATTNPGKIREFRLAASGPIEIEPLPGLKNIAPGAENGRTFEENAMEKAEYYGSHCNGYLFAEDSGLSVDALDGAPGVYSARFSGPNASDEENNRLLLERLKGIPNRSARYVCVIALASAGKVIQTFRGEVEGSITEEPRGDDGFGYDPLFRFEPFGATFAEMSAEQKQTISHRGHAMNLLLAYVRHHLV